MPCISHRPRVLTGQALPGLFGGSSFPFFKARVPTLVNQDRIAQRKLTRHFSGEARQGTEMETCTVSLCQQIVCEAKGLLYNAQTLKGGTLRPGLGWERWRGKTCRQTPNNSIVYTGRGSLGAGRFSSRCLLSRKGRDGRMGHL